MTLPARMNAIVLEGHGGLDRLVWHENWPVPRPPRPGGGLAFLQNTQLAGWLGSPVAVYGDLP